MNMLPVKISFSWWKTYSSNLNEVIHRLPHSEFYKHVDHLVDIQCMLEDWEAERKEFFENFEYAARMSYEDFLRDKEGEQSLEEFNQEQAPHKYIGY